MFWKNRISGWDIRAIYAQFDHNTGDFHLGIHCFGICGDADGDGDADHSSAELLASGGVDVADFQGSESFCIGLDMGGRGVASNVLGMC